MTTREELMNLRAILFTPDGDLKPETKEADLDRFNEIIFMATGTNPGIGTLDLYISALGVLK